MSNPTFFKETFDQLASEGVLGNPAGPPCYAYLRVSSAEQADEGRSGLPRQILHVHEAALANGYKVPWELVFADDHTGFAFEDRPALSALRTEYMGHDRRAHALVIENLDRLSRNADWHQGFLLDEMKKYGLPVHFWKAFSSRIERAVWGAISQEGMEQSLQRIKEGNLHKARSGRITARTRAYGYSLVDAHGNEGARARKETFYAPHPEEAPVIQLIFHKVGYEGMSTRALCSYLEERYAPPGRYRHWEPKQVALFIRNPVYKGQFVANRFAEVLVPARSQKPDAPVRLVKKRVQRPESEWISVAVPPLVSPDLWQQANNVIAKNAAMGRRNAAEPFLLTGLVTCAECGYRYVGGRKQHKRPTGTVTVHYYRCSARANRVPAMVKEIGCTQGQISCAQLDTTVWATLCRLLLDPAAMAEVVEQGGLDEEGGRTGVQGKRLAKHLAQLEVEDEKLYRAYVAGVFDEVEFGSRRTILKQKQQALQEELVRLDDLQRVQQARAERKALIMSFAQSAEAMGVALEAPFDVRQHVIKLVVDKIVLNASEHWFQIEGAIPGTFTYQRQGQELNIESIPVGRGSSRRRA